MMPFAVGSGTELLTSELLDCKNGELGFGLATKTEVQEIIRTNEIY